MKTWQALGLILLALCALLGLLVSPLALVLPVAFFGLLLFLRYPEVLAACAFAVGLVPEALMMAWGIPSVGLNLLDFAVLAMLGVALARWREVQAALQREKWICVFVVFVFAAGVVALMHGYLVGFGVRTAFRNFRFYFDLLVTFYFAALLRKPSQQRFVVAAWMLVVLVQIFLVSTNRIVYSKDDLGTLLLAPSINWTSTHFLPVKTFYPGLLALSILAVRDRHRRVLLSAGLWGMVGLQLIVSAFTYRRSLYVGLLAGLLVVAVGMLVAEWHRTRHGVRLLVRMGAVTLALIVASSTAFVLAVRSTSADAAQVRENLLKRVLFVEQMETDSPIQERLEGLRAGWNDIRSNPLLGTGLGDSVSYLRAEVFHNGWLWVPVSAGLPALLALALAIAIVGIKTLRTLGIGSETPWAWGLRLGFLASLGALAANTLFWTSTLDISDVFDWGLLLGVLTVSIPRQLSREVVIDSTAQPDLRVTGKKPRVPSQTKARDFT